MNGPAGNRASDHRPGWCPEVTSEDKRRLGNGRPKLDEAAPVLRRGRLVGLQGHRRLLSTVLGAQRMQAKAKNHRGEGVARDALLAAQYLKLIEHVGVHQAETLTRRA